jgi:hypothetical protein
VFGARGAVGRVSHEGCPVAPGRLHGEK